MENPSGEFPRNRRKDISKINIIVKYQIGLPEEMSCGGRFRQRYYEDRRV